MTKEEPEMKLEDSEDYRSKDDGVTIKTIILEQYRKCCREGSKEMTEGGVIRRLVNNQVMEFVVPNQIEIFINSVEVLRIILQPNFKKKEKVIKKYIDEYEKEITDLMNTYNKRISEAKRDLINQPPELRGSFIRDYNKFINNEERRCNIAKVNIYRKLLIGISILLDEMDYFEEVSSTI